MLNQDHAGFSSSLLGAFRLPSTPSLPSAARFSPPDRVISPLLANIEFQKLSTSALSLPYIHFISTFPSVKERMIRIGISTLLSVDDCWSLSLRRAALDHVFPFNISSSSFVTFGTFMLMDMRYGIIFCCSSEMGSGGSGSCFHTCAGGRRVGLISLDRNLSCSLAVVEGGDLHQVI